MSQFSVALDPGFNALVRRGLVRLHDAHVHALGKVLNDSLSVIHPNQRRTARDCLDLFTTRTVEALSQHLESVRRFILESLDTTKTVLTEATVEELVGLVQAELQPDLYVVRFDVFESSFARHVAAYGSSMALSDFRPDLSKAALHVGTANRIRAFSGELRDAMLTILERQRNERLSTENPQEQLADQMNKFFKLEPNLFGIGLNFNYLIRRLRGKKE